MNDDLLERWMPDAKLARIPLQLEAITPVAMMLTVVVAFFALATRSFFPFAILAFVALVWAMRRNNHHQEANLLTHGVVFELTTHCVRVWLNDTNRELPLSEIKDVAIVHVKRTTNVGHVVFHRRGENRVKLAIPTGRRVSSGTVGLVTWANVEHVDPAEQLFHGALTFWFVAHPDEIRARVQAAAEGISPHSRGPHR